MKRRLNIKNLITAIIIGEIMIIIFWLLGLGAQNANDIMMLLILFPTGIIALALITASEIYCAEKIEEGRTNKKREKE